MVLTSNQRNQLNKDILEYLVRSEYLSSAEVFVSDTGANLADVDPEGNRLEFKYKALLSCNNNQKA